MPTTETRTPLRVLVFGSCVSRDALAMAPSDSRLLLVGYYARSSLASLSRTPGAPNVEVDRIVSPFQRRMVKADHEKLFLRALTTLKFDVLLIDLIDERFNVLHKPDGNVITCSNEYLSVANRPLSGTVIASGSFEHVRLWRQGLARLVAKLDALGLRQQVRINSVFWAERDTEGKHIAGFTLAQIASANAFLRERYLDLESVFGTAAFLRYSPELLTSDPSHRWGVSAFHYGPQLYASTLNQLGLQTRDAATVAADEDVAVSFAAPSASELPLSASKTVRVEASNDPSLSNLSPRQTMLKLTPFGLEISVLGVADSSLEFAYYLFRDQQRVDTRWYSPRTSLSFPCPTIAGTYFVSVFQRHRPSGHVERYRTRPLQLPLATQYAPGRWSNHVEAYTGRRRIVPVDGVHRSINNGLSSFDLLLHGFEANRTASTVLVCFSGAVSDRERKVGPFFAGISIGRACKLPTVAVADPTLTRANDIGLGWYAGNDQSPKLAREIAERLDELADTCKARLLLIGGSGGGFAALAVLGYSSTTTSAIVWNAQTAITKYYPAHAYRYVRCAFPELSRKARIDRQSAAQVTPQQLAACLDEGGVLHDLTADAPQHHHPALFLQNISDHHHVDDHLLPFLRSREARWRSANYAVDGTGLLAWTGNWGEGHIPPPKPFLESIIREAAAGTGLHALAERLDTGVLPITQDSSAPATTV